MDILSNFLTWIGNKLNYLAAALCSILPNSPFQFVALGAEYRTWLAWVNYFVPFGTIVAIGETWLTCIAIYYACMVGLRWAKTLGD